MYIIYNKKSSWPATLRTIHRWLALLAVIPIVIWLSSGLYLTNVSVSINSPPLLTTTSQLSLGPIATKYFPFSSVTLTRQANQLVYQINNHAGSTLLDATTGQPIVIDQAYIKRRAAHLYQGQGVLSSIAQVAHQFTQQQINDPMIWRVVYRDKLNSVFYFSITTAELLVREDDSSRLHAIATSLHLMTIDSDKPYVLWFALVLGLSLTIIGLWLIFYSFNKDDKEAKRSVVRSFHKWLGVLIGAQMLIWMVSALIMSVNSISYDGGQLSSNSTSLILDATSLNFKQRLSQSPHLNAIIIGAGESKEAVSNQLSTTVHLMKYGSVQSWLVTAIAVMALMFVGAGLMLLLANLFSRFNANAASNRHQIDILGRYDFTDKLMVNGNQPLLVALGEQGFALPSGCGGSGTCCQCMIKGISINQPISVQEQTSLSVSEINQGFRLACQIQVVSDITIEISEKTQGLQQFDASVISNTFLTPFIKELVVTMPYGTSFSFESGQFVNVHVPPFTASLSSIMVPPSYQKYWQKQRVNQAQVTNKLALERSYSMASSTEVNNRLVFNVGLALPKNGYGPGVASSYLFGLKKGDNIRFSGPLGDFLSDNNSAREMVLVGAGSGMAPLKSHVDTLLANGERRRMSLWFGARTQDDIFYQQHFEQLMQRYRTFRWVVSLSQPHEDWQGKTGHIQTALFKDYLDKHPTITECEFYLCGPATMMRDITRLLHRKGVNASQIHCDDFG